MSETGGSQSITNEMTMMDISSIKIANTFIIFQLQLLIKALDSRLYFISFPQINTTTEISPTDISVTEI